MDVFKNGVKIDEILNDDIIELPPPEPTTEERIETLEQMNDMLLDMVAENTYELCLMSLGIEFDEED